MTNTITDILVDLQKFYGKKLSESQLNFYRSELAELDETDLCSGILAVKRSEPSAFFPSMITIRKYASIAKQQRLDLEKVNAPIFKDLERNAKITPAGRESFSCMNALYDGKMTRVEYLAWMFDMETRHPGVGWAEQASELEAFWNDPNRVPDGTTQQTRNYLTRIWRMQDANGFKTFNNPPWYKPLAKETDHG